MERTKIKDVDIMLPLICNMKCSYCYHNKAIRPQNYIDNLEDKIIPILDKLELDDNVLVYLAGGEDMLMQDRLMKCIRKFKKYEREHNVKFYYKITANGTKAEDLVNYIDNGLYLPQNVNISYDGKDSDRTYIDINTLTPLLKYKDKINIRVSLSNKSIYHLYNTINEVSDFGFKCIEYYFLYENDGYTDDNIVSKFKEELDKIMPLQLENKIILYNYLYAKEKKKEFDKTGTFKKGMFCYDIKKVNILADGNFTPCANISNYMINTDKYTYNENSTIEEIEEGYTLLKNFYSKPHCNSNKCGNYQCRECSLYATQHRDVHQQCKMRNVEKEIFEKYMKLEHFIK